MHRAARRLSWPSFSRSAAETLASIRSVDRSIMPGSAGPGASGRGPRSDFADFNEPSDPLHLPATGGARDGHGRRRRPDGNLFPMDLACPGRPPVVRRGAEEQQSRHGAGLPIAQDGGEQNPVRVGRGGLCAGRHAPRGEHRLGDRPSHAHPFEAFRLSSAGRGADHDGNRDSADCEFGITYGAHWRRSFTNSGSTRVAACTTCPASMKSTAARAAARSCR